MKFQKFYHITEISQKHVNKINTDVTKLLTDQKLPFNHIFGTDKLRIVESFDGTNPYDQQIRHHTDDVYSLDLPNWVGYKLTDKEKKNPIRVGKILNKLKEGYLKEYKTWMAENNVVPPSTSDTVARAKEYIERLHAKKIEGIDKLLKTVELQKQYQNSFEKLHVVYSRAPIDVLRMSDHGTHSCHAPDGLYFNCALADAMLRAGIAYLITDEDYKKIENNLQAPEIFKDKDRSVDGIQPLARIRIRAVIDSSGNTIAVPSAKIYGTEKFRTSKEFVTQVLDWAKKQDISHFNWNSILKLRGGSYQDSGHDVATYIRKIWGKDVHVSIAADEERHNEDEGDMGVEQDHGREHMMDALRESISLENWDQTLIWDDASDANDICHMRVRVGSQTGTVRIQYVLPKYALKDLGLDASNLNPVEKSAEEIGYPNDSRMALMFSKEVATYDYLIRFSGEDFEFDLDAIVDAGEGFRTYKHLVETKVAEYFSKLGIDFVEEEADITRLKMNNLILKMYGLPEKSLDDVKMYGSDFREEFYNTNARSMKALLITKFNFPHEIYAYENSISYNGAGRMDQSDFKRFQDSYEQHYALMTDVLRKYLEDEHEFPKDDDSGMLMDVLTGRVSAHVYGKNNIGGRLIPGVFNHTYMKISPIGGAYSIAVENQTQGSPKVFELLIEVDHADLNSLIDRQLLGKYYNAFKAIIDDGVVEDATGSESEAGWIDHAKAEEYVNSGKVPKDHPNQMRLDLSKVVLNKGKFNNMFRKLLREVNGK